MRRRAPLASVAAAAAVAASWIPRRAATGRDVASRTYADRRRSRRVVREPVDRIPRGSRREPLPRSQAREASAAVTMSLGHGISVQLPGSVAEGAPRQRHDTSVVVHRAAAGLGGAASDAVTVAVAGDSTTTSATVTLSTATVRRALGETGDSGRVRTVWSAMARSALPALLLPPPPPEAGAPNVEAQLARSLAAMTEVAEALELVAAATRTDGFRHVEAFPPALIEMLWRALRLHAGRYGVPNRHRHAYPKKSAAATAPGPPPTPPQPLQAPFRALRRALALRTVVVADQMTSGALVACLHNMQRCGALADDVVGPIGTLLVHQHLEKHQRKDTSTNHLLTRELSVLGTHPGGHSAPRVPFSPAESLVLACALGRQVVPDHFQLHQLVHVMLVPGVVEVLPEVNDPAALLLVTRCFIWYAVSGAAVEALTHRIAELAPQFAAHQLVELLDVLGGFFAVGPARGSGGRREVRQRRRGAEEEYGALVQLAVQRAVQHCVGGSSGVVVSATQLARVLRAHAALNPVDWAASHLTLATLLAPRVSQLAMDDTRLLLRSLLRRNSHIPDHPLHGLLAGRLLLSQQAARNVHFANTALLAAGLMIPQQAWAALPASGVPETGATSGVSPDGDAQLEWLRQRQHHALATLHCGHSASLTRPPQACGTPSALLSMQQRATSLLVQHVQQFSIHSFISALAVADLASLPLPVKQALVQHFTSVASAVDAEWLARGITALVRQLPDIVDAVSLERWLSPLTATDKVRELSLHSCAALLFLLSPHPQGPDAASTAALAFSVSTLAQASHGPAALVAADRHARAALAACAPDAKRSIVHRLSAILMREEVPLNALPTLIVALQASHVFFASVFSRLCRVLLSQVQQAPLELLLPAFVALADEYTRRPYHATGSLFTDVWEVLRTRVMECASSASGMAIPELVLALNAFAALDAGDLPLFTVLVHSLWQQMKPLEMPQAPAAAAALGDAPIEVTVDDVDAGTAPVSQPHAELRHLEALTPSAVVSLVLALTRLETAACTDVLLPWALVQLRPRARDLYPIDAALVLPALSTWFTLIREKSSDGAARCGRPWWVHDVNRRLLHQTYDACRAFFLYLYGPAAPAGHDGGDGDRGEWDGKVRLSTRLPAALFVDVVVAVAASGLQDLELTLACAAFITSRYCLAKGKTLVGRGARAKRVSGTLPVHRLVDLALAYCFHFAHPVAEGSVESTVVATAAVADGTDTKRKEHLKVVLDALWSRTEELSVLHITALTRCLRVYFGDRVDADFMARLEAQRQLLEQRQASLGDSAAAAAAAAVVDRPAAPLVDVPAEEVVVPLTPDDLFGDDL